MQLSKRLQKVASFVTEGNVLADIGTDHGYIPIYLVKNGICPSAYAMDINKGPLERAKEHIENEGLQEKIVTRLSDGLDKLCALEADTVLIAGMGGALIIDILKRGKDVLSGVKELVLSPHSEWEEVRAFILENGYVIIREEMLIDADKYYVIIKAVKGAGRSYSDRELKYGKLLIESKDKVLKQYLSIQKDKYIQILKRLEVQNSEKAEDRAEKIQKELECVEKVLLEI